MALRPCDQPRLGEVITSSGANMLAGEISRWVLENVEEQIGDGYTIMRERAADPYRAGGHGPTARELKARGLLIASSLGLCAAALTALGLGLRFVLAPWPERCPLPALVASNPVADFTWAPDGKQLLAAATRREVWRVHFPDVRSERLPPFPQLVSRTGWDRNGTPWLVSPEGLARLRADGRGWDRFAMDGQRARSPDGRWIAELRPAIPSTSRTRGKPWILSIRAQRQPHRDREIELPSGYGYRYTLAWMDHETVLLHRTGLWRPTPLMYRPRDGRLRELCPAAPTPPNQVSLEYQPRSGLSWSLYDWLLQFEIPGFPYRRYRDYRLSVSGAGGAIPGDIPVGRRHHPGPGRGNFWQAAKLSPDGRFVVFRASDDTLRVLDLRAAPPDKK